MDECMNGTAFKDNKGMMVMMMMMMMMMMIETLVGWLSHR